jgi:hypothetical protein
VGLSPSLVLAAGVLAGVAACGGSGVSAAPTSRVTAPSSTAAPTASGVPAVASTSAVVTPPITVVAADVVIDCSPGPATREPRQFVLACGDDGELLTQLVWSRWSATGATATGTDRMHVCTPNCAVSTTYVDYPATLTLSRPVTPASGTPHFTDAVADIGGSWRTDYPGGDDPESETLPTH